MNAHFFARPLKTGDKSGKQIEDEQTTKQISSGNRDGQRVEEFSSPELFGVVPDTIQRLKELRLGTPYPNPYLFQCGHEDKNHRETEQRQGDAQIGQRAESTTQNRFLRSPREVIDSFWLVRHRLYIEINSGMVAQAEGINQVRGNSPSPHGPVPHLPSSLRNHDLPSCAIGWRRRGLAPSDSARTSFAGFSSIIRSLRYWAGLTHRWVPCPLVRANGLHWQGCPRPARGRK